MRILGIDPGYATIGFGLVEAERAQMKMVTYGAITTPAGLPLSKRLYQIGTDMEDLISQLKPDVISIEELFFNTNITTGIAVAHGRGVILYAAEKCGVPLYEYTPSQVKQAVVGFDPGVKIDKPVRNHLQVEQVVLVWKINSRRMLIVGQSIFPESA